MRWRNRAWSSTTRILSGMGGVLASKPCCIGEGASLARIFPVLNHPQVSPSWFVHETGDGFLQVPRTFRAGQLHRVSGVGDADGDRERNPADVVERRIERPIVEVLGRDQPRERSGGGQEKLIGDAARAAHDGAQPNSGKYVSVVALSRSVRSTLIRHPAERTAAGKYRPAAAPLVSLL